MSTKYYTVEPKDKAFSKLYRWIIVVEDDIIVWSQAFNTKTGEWEHGIYEDYYIHECFFAYDFVEF
jgi:hypothetical protein